MQPTDHANLFSAQAKMPAQSPPSFPSILRIEQDLFFDIPTIAPFALHEVEIATHDGHKTTVPTFHNFPQSLRHEYLRMWLVHNTFCRDNRNYMFLTGRRSIRT